MKNKLIFLASFLLLSIFTSCKKNDPVSEENKPFDINHLEQYCVLAFLTDLPKQFNLISFESGNVAQIFFAGGGSSYLATSYTIIDDHTIRLEEQSKTVLTFQNGMVSSPNNPNIKPQPLIKKPTTNELAGKTFSGKLYRANGTVLYTNLFYKFSSSGTKVEKGFATGVVEQTDSYTLIGNMAASIGSGDAGKRSVELIVLVDDQLQFNYYNYPQNETYYGTLKKE